MVVDLSVLDSNGLFNNTPAAGKNIFSQSTLNPLMSLGKNAWKMIRKAIQDLLFEDNPALRDNNSLREKAFGHGAGAIAFLAERIIAPDKLPE